MAVESPIPAKDAAVELTPEPALPDYVTDPNAVLKDTQASWRYGRPPDYSKTRAAYEETKKSSHSAASLPDLVENLVKNWEVEASFKTDLKDWRTIDRENYSFGINGGPLQTGEHMLKVGTYNAIIASNEYYSPEFSDFASSHKTFKRMMPTFAWEVLEVYSGPPKVAFRWRHWGLMKNDYVGFNDKGEKVTAKAHGGPIDIEGVTVAEVNEKLQLQKVETWFDPLEMFRQIVPHGIVNKQPISAMPSSVSLANAQSGVASAAPCPVMSKSSSSLASSQSALAMASGCPVMSSSSAKAELNDDQKVANGAPHDEGRLAAEVPKESDTNEAVIRSTSEVATPQQMDMTATEPTGTEEPKVTATRAAEQSQGTTAQSAEAPVAQQATTSPHTQPDVTEPQPQPPQQDESHEAPTTTSTTGSTSTKHALSLVTPATVSSRSQHQSEEQESRPSMYTSPVTGPHSISALKNTSVKANDDVPADSSQDYIDAYMEQPAGSTSPHPHDLEHAVNPCAGEGIAVELQSDEARATKWR